MNVAIIETPHHSEVMREEYSWNDLLKIE